MIRGCAALGALALVVSACGSSATSPPKPSPSPTGTVTGRLLTYGGLSLNPQGRPFSGHVKATDANGKSVVVSVPSDGRFALQLKTGTYALTGSSPEFGGGQYGCFAEKKVQVTVDGTISTEVVCHER